MGQRHKHADVIIAWAEWKDVQVWSDINNKWYDLALKDPSFNGKNYRIKPPAKKYRVALFKAPCVEAVVSVANSEHDAERYKESGHFVRWLTDWIEYEE